MLSMAGCGANNTAIQNEEAPLSTQAAPPEIDINIMSPGIFTFRAEVLELNPGYSPRVEELLLVYSITPVSGHDAGGRYFIRQNDSIVILDYYGEPVSHLDIPAGAIVDITYYGIVLQSLPAVIPGAISIQVVE